MKRIVILTLVTIASYQCGNEIPNLLPVEYVNTLMGTHSNRKFSHGNTYPAVARPWGMNFWTAQTGVMNDTWTYTYNADSIRGFRQTHSPSPWIGDYGSFSIMPVSGTLKLKDRHRAAAFSHVEEKATPYYYSVKLQDSEVLTEITATERCAVFRFTFSKEQNFLVIDAWHQGASVKIIPGENKVVGYCRNNSGGTPENFANYFVLQFDQPFESFGVWNLNEVFPEKEELKGNYAGAYLQFPAASKQVILKAASSFISPEQAQRNLDSEVGVRSFAQVCNESRDIWNRQLSRIEIKGGTEEQLRTFYSNFYRTSLYPRKFYEYDAHGNPVHYSPFDGNVYHGFLYTDNGFWDTFRSAHPWMTLLFPSVSEEIMQSLVNIYSQGGWLPSWASPGYRNAMIGSHAVSLIADAYQKGIKGFDVEKAYEAALKDCFHPAPETYMGRYGFEHYNEKGYVPYPQYMQSTSMSLEYAYDDWCIMQLAKMLGKKEDEVLFARRAMNYRNSFDPATSFMRPRNEDGTWYSPFDGFMWGGPFTEGNSWQYSWSVMHDMEGLIELMGGAGKFAEKLDALLIAPLHSPLYGRDFNEIAEMHAFGFGQYAHGNQPSQHIPYLYNYAGQPWKTQRLVRKIMDRFYRSTPEGYYGDEDNGQTSSWYLFSALGFYPVCPGSGQYIIGSPLFRSATIHLENGKTFEIQAPENNDTKVFVTGKSLNSKPYTALFINHEEIVNGGVLRFKMADRPDKEAEIKPEDKPYSLSNTVNKIK